MKPGAKGDQLAMKLVFSSALSVTVTLALAAGCTGEGIHAVGEVPGTSATGGSTGAAENAQSGSVGGKGGYGGLPSEATGGSSGAQPAGATGGEPAEDGAAGAPGAENCVLREVTTTPTNLSPTDQCDATYDCDDDRAFTVSCDGENDGTNTSLCSCHSGQTGWNSGDLFQGEGPETCLAAAATCAETMPDHIVPEPEEEPPAIEACVFQDIKVIPSENSPTDRCEATYLCDDSASFSVGCGGENDGTNTSLCDCHFDDQYRSLYGEGGLFQGEGPESCLAAVVECAEVMKAWNER
jgi:hypothetical protein